MAKLSLLIGKVMSYREAVKCGHINRKNRQRMKMFLKFLNSSILYEFRGDKMSWMFLIDHCDNKI